MKKLPLLFFLLVFGSSKAQDNSYKDSLHTAIETYEEQDTTFVNLLSEYSRMTIRENLEKNIPLLKKALQLSKKLDYTKGSGHVFNIYCTYYLAIGQLDSAIFYGNKSVEKFKLINDTKNILPVNTNLGIIYFNMNKFDKALEIHLNSIEIIKNDPDSPGKARFYFYAGKTYHSILDYENTEKYYQKAKSIAQNANFETGIAIANGALGGLYSEIKQYDKALPLIQSSLNFALKSNHTSTIIGAYYSLGACYRGLKQTKKAIKTTNKAIELSIKNNNLPILQKAYFEQYENNIQAKNHENAIKYLELHHAIKDSILDLEKTKLVEEYQTKYETDKIKNENELAKKEAEIANSKNEKNKLYLYSISVISLLIIIGLIFFIQRFNARKKAEMIALELEEIQRRLQIEQEQRKAELKALKSQMNPHFIFNSINSIQDLVLQQDVDTSYDYIVHFSNLVRGMLSHSDNEFISLEKEIDFLNTYLKLEKLRFGDELNYEIKLTNLNEYEIDIPSLIVQPFVENALLHGLLHKKGIKNLDIEFKMLEGLICTISDNGIGREESKKIKERQNQNHESFAMEAIRKRLEILKIEYGNDIGFSIKDLEEGTQIEIILPYKSHF